ncbi:hypothetical protein HKBW3S03_01214 [Candidatus Hakubella thermalkaliphila]|uniref:Uncharacterized protein n=1 Tax=Candidatus Hakubella thermalkaliphila TaxID=2754717 RepID=A0A6V8QBP4_9ACTN|nr:hypothetical protein [Candidatus Hakubella thermalkaliphila]GFP19709.1 hypothetical protein HKBW3S03_01214 [Candidatus Hakubella thermalkaliphila]GFP25560.1 hypothetical protein HKBW3S25_01040 [Candidatus Hakubella thermalkaliphila]GFP40301.1 hypothetical protein HKBW3S47_01997 [Candidatus Hakubella thermalkaliphila]
MLPVLDWELTFIQYYMERGDWGEFERGRRSIYEEMTIGSEIRHGKPLSRGAWAYVTRIIGVLASGMTKEKR